MLTFNHCSSDCLLADDPYISRLQQELAASAHRRRRSTDHEPGDADDDSEDKFDEDYEDEDDVDYYGDDDDR